MNKIYLIGLIVFALLVGGGLYWYSQQFPKPVEVVAPPEKEEPLPTDITDASQTLIEEVLLETNEVDSPLPEEDANFLEEANAAYEEEPVSGL